MNHKHPKKSNFLEENWNQECQSKTEDGESWEKKGERKEDDCCCRETKKKERREDGWQEGRNAWVNPKKEEKEDYLKDNSICPWLWDGEVLVFQLWMEAAH